MVIGNKNVTEVKPLRDKKIYCYIACNQYKMDGNNKNTRKDN